MASETPEFASGRAYYAMFYATQALLQEKGIELRKHGTVHSAFGEHFIKTNLLDTKLHRWLLPMQCPRKHSPGRVTVAGPIFCFLSSSGLVYRVS